MKHDKIHEIVLRALVEAEGVALTKRNGAIRDFTLQLAESVTVDVLAETEAFSSELVEKQKYILELERGISQSRAERAELVEALREMADKAPAFEASYEDGCSDLCAYCGFPLDEHSEDCEVLTARALLARLDEEGKR